MHDRILILDYGSQYTQLIARRIREERVYCEIHPPTHPVEWIREWNPTGIVLSGGPSSVYGEEVPTAEPELLTLGVPILGLVENMSYFVCPDTGKRHDIFGPSHAEETARRLGASFLGRLPIDPRIAQLCDSGAIEDYAAEGFAPIAQILVETAPEARCPVFTSMREEP